MTDEETKEDFEVFTMKLTQELHMSQLYVELKFTAKVRN